MCLWMWSLDGTLLRMITKTIEETWSVVQTAVYKVYQLHYLSHVYMLRQLQPAKYPTLFNKRR